MKRAHQGKRACTITFDMCFLVQRMHAGLLARQAEFRGCAANGGSKLAAAAQIDIYIITICVIGICDG